MNASTYSSRRNHLRKVVGDDAILFIGQDEAPRNYPANPYPFRQDSHFLYYVGTNLPGMAILIFPDGAVTMYGPGEDPDDLIWHGPHPVLEDHARAAGIDRTAEFSTLGETLANLKKQGVTIRYLPPYRAEATLKLTILLGVSWFELAGGACRDLAMAVVEQRSIKTDEEVAEMERAHAVSKEMYARALGMIKPGILEADVAGAMQGVALRHDMPQSFLPIVSVRGEVLHNNTYTNVLEDGDLLLVDSGVEAPPGFYASDITRTFPVSGKYTDKQKGIYQIVLDMQIDAIAAASPRVSNRDIHFIAARTAVEGLKGLGLMKGDVDRAVEAGAHALFFPHGLGHMIGGDVHDMEDLGDLVGYPKGDQRSKQFGLSFLRLAKKLRPGFVITVEPGIYFVPALIERWKGEGKNADFINFNEVEKYIGFGGVRIEDDVLITENGSRVLGDGIPKTIEDVEGAMAR